jgi:hypothetical protein
VGDGGVCAGRAGPEFRAAVDVAFFACGHGGYSLSQSVDCCYLQVCAERG